ncbi:hypothetical protein Q7P37_010818 [Cladosporium fusiforme]
MELKAAHGRMLVGLQRGSWRAVWYEPIGPLEDLTVNGHAPDVALFFQSRGDTDGGEPMLGQVAFLPLFMEEHFESKVQKERSLMQRRLLYDAWRYLTAKEPMDVEEIRAQLEDDGSSARQRALLGQMDKCRKRKSRNAVQQRRRRMAKGLPAKTIENMSDSDSDDGYETDEGTPMAPPPLPRPALRVSNGRSAGRPDSAQPGPWRGLTEETDRSLLRPVARSASRLSSPYSTPRRGSTEESDSTGLFVTDRRGESTGAQSTQSARVERQPFNMHASTIPGTQSDSGLGTKRSSNSSRNQGRNVRARGDEDEDHNNNRFSRFGTGRTLSGALPGSGAAQNRNDRQLNDDLDAGRRQSPNDVDEEVDRDEDLQENLDGLQTVDQMLLEFNGGLDEQAALNETIRRSAAPE